jgi:hypothetical protein
MLRISNPRGWARGAGALVAFAAALTTTACHGMLDVKDVDVTASSNFVDASSVPALQASAVNGFVNAYENFVLYTGTLGDEWVISGTFPTRIEVDQRDIDPGNATLGALFPQISRARAIADYARQRMEAVDTAGTANAEEAEASALAGLSIVIMSEAYCEGTPISHFDETAADPFIYGGPLTREQVLDTAITHFNDALAVADPGSDEDYLARIGMGRALMDRGNAGDYDAAAAMVATVPTDWQYVAEHTTDSGQNNNIWSFNINQERFSVTDQEGGNGLPFLSSQDPRMLWDRSPANDVGFDHRTPSYNALKYSDRPAFTVIADGVEARLIEAEAALSDSDPTTMLQKLNDLRSQVKTLAPAHNYDYVTQYAAAGFTSDTLPQLTMPATTAAQVDLVFQERAYWLWLTAHRLGDMRRLIRQYGRAENTVFPTGLYMPNGNAKGGSYGTDVNFPIPVEEANNPNTSSDPLGQCTNRGA